VDKLSRHTLIQTHNTAPTTKWYNQDQFSSACENSGKAEAWECQNTYGLLGPFGTWGQTPCSCVAPPSFFRKINFYCNYLRCLPWPGTYKEVSARFFFLFIRKLIVEGILCPGDLAISVEKMSGGGLRSNNEEQPEHSLLVTKPGANIFCESSGHFWTVKKLHLESAVHASINKPICLFLLGLLWWVSLHASWLLVPQCRDAWLFLLWGILECASAAGNYQTFVTEINCIL